LKLSDKILLHECWNWPILSSRTSCMPFLSLLLR